MRCQEHILKHCLRSSLGLAAEDCFACINDHTLLVQHLHFFYSSTKKKSILLSLFKHYAPSLVVLDFFFITYPRDEAFLSKQSTPA